MKILFLYKFGPKNQNALFKVKFGHWANSNMWNLMVIYTFCVLEKNILFRLSRSKIQNYFFKVMYGIYIPEQSREIQ